MLSCYVVGAVAIQCHECAYLMADTGNILVNDLIASIFPWNDMACLEDPQSYPLRTCEHPSQRCVAMVLDAENTAEALGFRE